MKSALLALGGAVIVGAALWTLSHLSDAVVLQVLLPGVALGLVLIAVSLGLEGRGRRSG